MEWHLKIVIVLLSELFWLQNISGESSVDGGLSKIRWTCLCASGPQGATNYSIPSNCSSGCECRPDESRGSWNCSCLLEMSNQVSGNVLNGNCFSSCKCSSGSFEASIDVGKHYLSKAMIAVLILCSVIATSGFLVSVACCLYHKSRFSRQRPKFQLEKDIHWNSSGNLFRHYSASLPEFQVNLKYKSNSFTEFFHKICTFKSYRGALPGTITQFCYTELELATKGFLSDNLIGCGGSSSVYRGELKDGCFVAIKKLDTLGGEEADSAFLTEIELISRLNHCHVVPLLGYCLENRGKQTHRILVFEYMTKGNLRECLDARHGNEPVDWATRINIALGVAKGLEYLHEAAAPRILHRDIKSSNILLDEMYRAKITDLGMAKCLIGDDIASYPCSPARMQGTFGYFAPEYAVVGKASPKSDVFSFGVVILELITGRQPIKKLSNKIDESLVLWASTRLRDSKLVISELPDPLLKGRFAAEEMQIMAHLARECLQWDPDTRPTMCEIVQIISTIAPTKSTRMSLSLGHFMRPGSMRSTTELPKPHDLSGRQEESQTLNGSRESRRSLPMSFDRILCIDPQNTSQMVHSPQYVERLVLLPSNIPSYHSSDDESVDLTEPRFESFVQSNIRSS